MTPDNKKRRLFLHALALCLAAGSSNLLAAAAHDGAAPLAAELDQFLKAASNLTGLKLTDRELARTYFNLLRQQFGMSGMEALSAATTARASRSRKARSAVTPSLAPIEEQAILLWCTGITSDPATGQQEVLAYTDAAVWQALPFTKPPGQCGGAFGYWADAPART
jgi:hypothetical protein